MARIFLRLARCVALMVGVCVITSVASADPGFGLASKRKLKLATRKPAAIRLANTSFAVTGAATDAAYAPAQASLMATLETELVANEKSLIKKSNPAEAEWVLNIRVTGYSAPASTQRTSGTGSNAVTTIQWLGSLRAGYEVLDHSGKPHAAANVEATYDSDHPVSARTQKTAFGIPINLPGMRRAGDPNPQSSEDVKQLLIHEVVEKISANLGNTKKIIEVQVATGDDPLKRAADFMDNGLWSRALELLEKTPPYRPDLDAYRQYDLGLVYEAMSYDSVDAADQRENLSKAVEYYDKALEVNSKERYFIETVARAKEANASLQAFMNQKATPEPVISPPAAPVRVAVSGTPVAATQPVVPPVAPPPAPSAPKVSKALTVTDVIDMFSAKVPQDQIIPVIQGAAAVDFNPLDKDTVVAMAKANLPIVLQNELRKKVGAPLLQQSAARVIPKPAASPAAPTAPTPPAAGTPAKKQ